MEKKIKKVAVLGAGVMGAQIAGHLGNAGIHYQQRKKFYLRQDYPWMKLI